MNVRKIYIVSPREPSGATWLINCLLELGVKTYRHSPEGMWGRKLDKFMLNTNERILKKWLPALNRYVEFSFRGDLEVQWTHMWPREEHSNFQVIYFVRDPRDSIYSRFKRENPDQSLKEFLQFPDVNTLLDKADNWSLFNKCWLSHPKMKVFRFEDYKHDAFATLKEITSYIGIDVSDNAIRDAVSESTYEKAVESEEKYKREHPEDSELINRGGAANEWMVREDSNWLCQEIEARCGDLLDRLGYPFSSKLVNKETPKTNFQINIRTLGFFQSLIVPESIKMEENEFGLRDNNIAYLIEFTRKLSSEILRKSKIKDYECRFLINSLKECFSKNRSLINAGDYPAKTILDHIKSIEREMFPYHAYIPKRIVSKLFSLIGK